MHDISSGFGARLDLRSSIFTFAIATMSPPFSLICKISISNKNVLVNIFEEENKMRKFSKGISLILAICMIIAMVPAAFAADEATTVTVSMKAEELGSIDTSNPYSVWKNRTDVRLADTDFTRLNWDCECKLLRGESVSKNTFFSFDVQAVEGTYAIEITPITTGMGCSYNVFVDGQFAGRVDTRDDSVGDSSFVIASSAQKLNTLALTPDEDGWVNIRLENVSAFADLANPYNFRMGFSDITLTPLSGSISVDRLNENISDAELYVDKTLDFVIAPVMSDGSTRYFDTSDANSYITASVEDESSVTITEPVMKSDGLHGKITGVAAEAATINVAVTLAGVTTNHAINITPIAALVPETRKIIPHDTTLILDRLAPGGQYNVDFSTQDIIWLDGKTEVIEDKTDITKYRQVKPTNYSSLGSAGLGNYYRWPLGEITATRNPQFTMRTKLASGTYAISLTPMMNQLGCTYGVWVNGQYAGKVDSWNGTTGTSGWSSALSIGTTQTLNTLNITSDSENWVEIVLKNLSSASEVQSSSTVSIGFMDITLTPVTETAVVASLSENISTTDIYKGETSDFYIKAVMNDGTTHMFDTTDTADKIEVSVPAGSAVEISEPVMKEDGLYGKITGVGEDEKAEITVKTTINGVVDTKTIDVISFATEVKTPETIVISMHTKGTGTGGIAYDNDVVHNKPNGNNYIPASSEITWGDGSKVRLDKNNTNITGFRECTYRACIAYPYLSSPSADTEYAFAMKVRAVAGTYKVDLTYPATLGGCKYEVIIGGTSVGTVDCSSTTGDWQEPTGSNFADLSNVTVTPDEDGWVSVKLKYLGEGANTTHATARALFFTNITLTPTVKLYAAADTVDGNVDGLVTAEGYTAGNVANVAFGEKITLTANNNGDYTFLYWINNSSKMYISEEPTYTFDATSNLAISAVYTKAGNTRYDYFSDMGERISSGSGTAPTAPAIPTKIGYDVSAVTWESKKEHKVADYEAYAPDYSGEVAQTFTVNGEGNYSFNDPAEVSSDASNFSYWEKNDKIVSYNKTYSFFVWGNETVTAVCNGALTAAEKKPAVVLFSNGSDHMLELVGFDGIEIVEKGILFAEDGKPTISSNFGKAKSTTSNNQFAVTADYAVARAYVVYKDDANLKVVYSD